MSENRDQMTHDVKMVLTESRDNLGKISVCFYEKFWVILIWSGQSEPVETVESLQFVRNLDLNL